MQMFSHKLPPRDHQPGGFFSSQPDDGSQTPFGAPQGEVSQGNPFEPDNSGVGPDSSKSKSPWHFTWHSWTGLICLLLALLILVFMIILPLSGIDVPDGASSLLGAGSTVVTGVVAWAAVGFVGLVATVIGVYFVPSRKASAAVLMAALLATAISIVSTQTAMQSIVFRAQHDVRQGVLSNFDLESLSPDGADQIVSELGALNLDDKGLDVISEEDWNRMPPEARSYLEDELRNRFE